MSKLREKQIRFSYMVARLIEFAYANGYGISFGDAYRDKRCPYGIKNSLHRSRLAIDLNLFRRDPVSGEWIYLTKTEDHRPLGLFWESIGGDWGGRFDDGNHYSLEHNGVR